MQLFFEKFKDLALKYLDSENTCLMTVSAVYEDSFIESIKLRKDVLLVEITPENREQKEIFITQLIGKIEKTKKYLTEPEWFNRNGNELTVKGDHEIRTVSIEGEELICNCHFFNKNGNNICSNTISAAEFIKRKE